MSDRQNLQKLRLINNNTYQEVQHNVQQQSKSNKNVQQHQQHRCNHNHDHGSHKINGNYNKEIKHKNYFIIIYTVFTCLSCLYLQTQYLNPFISDKKSYLMTFLTYFDVFMALWSYFQTMRISSQVSKLQQKDPKPYKLDYTKRCDKCNYWKGPRYSHCSTCGYCIYKLDHHCIWTQTCIGHCNQRPFYLFCFYMTIGVIQFWYSTARTFSILSANCNFFGAFQPGIYILWGITCISAGLVGIMILGLCFGHSFFISTNFTTLQSMKTKRAFSFPFLECRPPYLTPDAINLWDRGQIQNLKQLFGTNILTFWMPFGREIRNQHIFESMNPMVQQLPQKTIISYKRQQLQQLYKDKKIKIKIDNKYIQL